MMSTVESQRCQGGVKARTAALCLLLLGLLTVRAGAFSQSPVVDLSLPLDGQAASPFVTLLEDPERRLQLRDVMRLMENGELRPLVNGRSNLGMSDSAYWLAFTAHNPTSSSINWMLETVYPHVDFVDVYLIDETGGVEQLPLGDMRPFHQRPLSHESFVVPVETEARARTQVMIRMAYSDYGLLDTQVRLWSPQAFIDNKERYALIMGAYFGGMLLMLLYNLFIYCSTHMREYFHYVCYLGVSLCFAVANLGLGHRYLYADSVFLTNHLHIILMMLTMVMLIQFSRTFLRTAESTPKLDRLLQISLVIAGVGIVALLLGNKVITTYILRGLGVFLLVLPVLSIWLWRRGERRVRYYTLGWVVAAAFFCVSLMRWLGLSETSFLSLWGGRIGLWFEAILFSFALADHINLLRREQESAKSREQKILLDAHEELEQKVRQRTRDLELARQEADQASRAKSAFLATMSHEIRTPMNGILGSTYLALNSNSGLDNRHHLDRIQSSAQYLLEIINNILDFSKIEAGKLKVEHIEFSLDEVMADISSLFVARAQTRNLDFRTRVAQQIPARLMGDPLRLKQVLVNLIGNAVKFTREGGIQLHIELEESRGKDTVILTFSVRDSGIGMSTEQQQALFQEFAQADDSTTREYGGTGLGLTISQRLVSQMGGNIEVSSALEEGSEFRFSLPFVVVNTPQATSVKSLGSAPPPQFAAAHVLLVEDNATNQQVARELLETAGLRVTIANNGLEALKKLEEQSIDLILMDVQMPFMDGYQATAMVRADERFNTVPIVAMTAHALIDDQERCFSAGMNGHISKPVDPHSLYHTLARWLPLELQPPAETVKRSAGDYHLPQGLPGVDLTSGLNRVRGNRQLFYKLLVEFFEDHRRQPEELNAALAEGDMKRVRKIAHNLKGAAGNLGAQDLSAMAAEVERTLAGAATISVNIEPLRACLQQVLDGLAPLADRKLRAPATSAVAVSWPTLSAQLQSLRALLHDANPQALELMRDIRAALQGRRAELLEELEQQINAFQFEDAEAALHSLVMALDEECKGDP
ncbi:response regulator [Pseudomaricurvus alkylphenolicus]|uniref:hybrid sensor histidine kinase/response regulator n=1 Tax=Pseudomaricurvus alkylphenolicus TaxID=1306991 RepID=UPI0014213548|nr:hybrid sensor histidine kinase/response regulator [Pseudomaricurvus alkylphenolicus]NIB39928.1 response regulator [Pseudomaricurvus alkylphenolicus]